MRMTHFFVLSKHIYAKKRRYDLSIVLYAPVYKKV